MLQELSIRNFAIIDDLQVSFSNGLTILSGETGAGKSILLQAVNLILGNRAGAAMIRAGADAAEIEALFAISPDSRAADAMRLQGLNPEDGLLIRRVISASDRHRIYINGKLATIQMLSAATENLASISGQHAHQGLLKEEQHLMILDQFAGLGGLNRDVALEFQSLTSLVQKHRHLQAAEKQKAERLDLLTFQQKEITDAAILPEEDSALEAERMKLKHAEMLYQSVHDSVEKLYAGAGSLSEQLSGVIRTLDKASQVDAALAAFSKTLTEAGFLIEDTAGNLRNYLNTLDMDDHRLEAVDARIDFLHKLKRKYGGTLEAVQAALTAIETELQETEHLSESLSCIEKDIACAHERTCRLACELSERRSAAAVRLAERIEAELAALRMPHARFQVALKSVPPDARTLPCWVCHEKVLTESGLERGVFMISPNPGEALKPLAQIASGGELSRVVLALKAILSATDAVETVIFDEVDAGIGGGVAEVVGKKLLALSRTHQVICITHLPQIARFGNHHFRICKNVQEGRTATVIQPLNPEERVKELARMLGGETITDAVWKHARELLEI